VSAKGQPWVEPLKECVNRANYAVKVASFTKDLHEVKSFTEKIGSNRLLFNKKVQLDFIKPFNFIAEELELAKQNPAPNGRGGQERQVWWAHQDLNLGPTDYESAALTN
jgi:hypothetical protein